MNSYVVKQLMVDAPDTLQVITEFDVLSRRTELSLDDINKNITSLTNSLKNVQIQIAKPPLNNQDKFAEQMNSFYSSANTELTELRDFYKETRECYDKTCASFGENGKSLKSTELFSYIVTFIGSLKTSHKHLLDLQAEEKVKKVTQDWQNLALSNSMHRQQASQEDTKKSVQPQQFRLPDLPQANSPVKNKTPPSLPASITSNKSVEQNPKNEKKRSLLSRLFKIGK